MIYRLRYMSPPVALPLPAHRMRQRQLQRAIGKCAVVQSAMILKPSCMNGILMEIAGAHVVMLSVHHAPQPRQE